MKSAKYWIEKLNLTKHPEGGYYKEVYRSENLINTNTNSFPDKRCFSTSIYFLLEKDNISAFHRIKSDELWHFYTGGSSITIYVIEKDGTLQKHLLGSNIEKGESFQVTIPAETWFAAELNNKDSFALVGCTVSPGFNFEDFELGSKKELAEKYREHKNLIEKFTI